jgi:hypothetical protein
MLGKCYHSLFRRNTSNNEDIISECDLDMNWMNKMRKHYYYGIYVEYAG